MERKRKVHNLRYHNVMYSLILLILAFAMIKVIVSIGNPILLIAASRDLILWVIVCCLFIISQDLVRIYELIKYESRR